MESVDFIVIGGGIAGASAGHALAQIGSVVLLERESHPGYHTTGRSAALFTETYGNAVIRGLTVGSKSFLTAPPPGFSAVPLMDPRPVLLVGRADQRALVEKAVAEGRALVPSVRQVGADEARAMHPLLRPGYAETALYEPDSMAMDVDAILQGYLKGIRARGGRIVTDGEVTALARDGKRWTVTSKAGAFAAPIVANASGAWADDLARLAGAAPVGLVPKRRTALTFDAPSGTDVQRLPMLVDVAEQWYVKPEAGRLLASPADETPSAPCDAQPEEMDVALCVERVTSAIDVAVRRIHRKWAGLRTFAADKTLVCGFDKAVPGFLWVAGQGGYGIQTSPAMGRIVAALVQGQDVPADLRALGVTRASLAPERFAAGR